MTTEQVGLGAAGAVALVALVVALLAHRRARRAESLVASLAEHVAVPSAPAAQAPSVAERDTAAFVITQVGTHARTTRRPPDPCRWPAPSTAASSPTSSLARPW